MGIELGPGLWDISPRLLSSTYAAGRSLGVEEGSHASKSWSDEATSPGTSYRLPSLKQGCLLPARLAELFNVEVGLCSHESASTYGLFHCLLVPFFLSSKHRHISAYMENLAMVI